jgi:hypothetical protein
MEDVFWAAYGPQVNSYSYLNNPVFNQIDFVICTFDNNSKLSECQPNELIRKNCGLLKDSVTFTNCCLVCSTV